MNPSSCIFSFFFFNDTATTEIYTLSLHDALPILATSDWRMAASSAISVWAIARSGSSTRRSPMPSSGPVGSAENRSEEHTSELQSRLHLVCRLLLEKKKKTYLS